MFIQRLPFAVAEVDLRVASAVQIELKQMNLPNAVVHVHAAVAFAERLEAVPSGEAVQAAHSLAAGHKASRDGAKL